MLICVKEKRSTQQPAWEGEPQMRSNSRYTLKGSIMIKKHLNRVESSPGKIPLKSAVDFVATHSFSPADDSILTLNLSVPELPSFHLYFPNLQQLDTWKHALFALNHVKSLEKVSQYEQDTSGTDEEDYQDEGKKESSSLGSSYAASRSHNTAPTEYSEPRTDTGHGEILPSSLHVPLDIVVVIPVSSAMHGLKITLLRDMLRFLVECLGERDRMGLVTFGSGGGANPLVGMTTKTWSGWYKIIDTIRPLGHKSQKADPVDGANIAMDLLMQRKSTNPLSSMLIVSDASSSDADSVDFVVSRAEAAKYVDRPPARNLELDGC